MLKNTVQPGRPQMTIWHMRIACRIHKATDTHSECVILIVFPQQQWLRERASRLRHSTLPVLFSTTCFGHTYWQTRPFCSTFPSLPVFLPSDGQHVWAEHVAENKNERIQLMCRVCVGCITSCGTVGTLQKKPHRKQDMQCTHNVAMSRIRSTTVAV